MEGDKNSLKFITADSDYCLGCKNCELACASLENSVAKIFIEQNEGQKSPNYCRHCSEAYCLQACPVDAIKRQDGAVILDPDKCVGCGQCKTACLYDVIRMVSLDNSNVAQKCDLCKSRQASGRPPACFSACPTKALQLKEYNGR